MKNGELKKNDWKLVLLLLLKVLWKLVLLLLLKVVETGSTSVAEGSGNWFYFCC